MDRATEDKLYEIIRRSESETATLMYRQEGYPIEPLNTGYLPKQFVDRGSNG